MATNAPKMYITLDEIIKNALTDIGDDSPHQYARFKTWALRGLNELQYDVLSNTKQKYLPVDANTKTALLPNDFVQWTRIGVITQGNEIQDLAHDPNLVYTPIEEEGCNPITDHCSCGCTDPLCAAISNSTTTTEDVIIPFPIYITYCDYQYTFDAPNHGEYPYEVTIVINGVISSSTTITQQSDLDTFFSNIGFTKNSDTDYSIIHSSDVYGNLVFAGQWHISASSINTVTLQKAQYTVPNVINFNGLSITLGGVLYTTASVYTSMEQILSWLNSLNTGFGSFTNSFNIIYAAACTATATYYGSLTVDTAGTPVVITAGNYTNNSTDQEYYLAPSNLPYAGATILIDGVTYSTNSTLVNISAVASWINSLGKAKATVATNDITITYNTANVNSVFTYPTTNVTITTNSVPTTTTTPMANLAEIVAWLNLQSLGVFGASATKIYVIDKSGQIDYDLLSVAWGGGSSSSSFSVNVIDGSLYDFSLITGIIDETDTIEVDETNCDTIITGYTNHTYQKTTTICTNDAGGIVGRICEPVVTNPSQQCTYVIDTDEIQYPIKDAYFTKNGQVVNVGYVEDFDVMYEIMIELGFSATGFIPPYHIEDCPDVWTSLTYTGTNTSEENYDYNEVFIIEFEQSECVNPTPTVETVCYDTILCAAPETKPCGCPVLNNEVVNTIQDWSTLFNEFIQRDLHGMDWQKALKQPLSWFGYFNVFPHLGVIQLDQHYPFDTVYIQYYTSNEADGGEFQVPVLAQEALAAYIIFKYTFNKSNVSAYNKKLYQKAWYNEKRKLHGRENPFRIAGYLDLSRQNPRP